MKKVLAIVLTLAMLLSSMIVGLSATRVVEEHKADNWVYNYPSGSSYCPISLGGQDSNFDIEMDIKLDADNANLGNCFGLAVNPVFSATSVGVDGAVVEGKYEVNRWYHVKWDNNGDGTTTLYVDGANVGTVNKVATLWDHDGDKVAFWAWNVVSIDNLRIGTYFNDMESNGPIAYDHNDNPTQGQRVLETNVTYTNENVYEVTDSNKYWQWDADNAYAYFEATSEASYQLSFDFRLDDATSETRNYGGMFILAANRVGVNGATQPVDLKVGEWYKVLYNSIAGNGTGIVIWNSANEIVAQTAVAENLPAKPCGGVILMSMDNLTVANSEGNVIWSEDFQDGEFQNKSDTNGIITSDKVTVRNDLGLKYASANANYGCFDVPGTIFSMDFALQAENGGAEALASGDGWCSFTITNKTVGVNGDTVNYNFDIDEWYNVTFDKSAGNGTDIYVNGAKIGHVGTEFSSGSHAGKAIQTMRSILMDNITSKNADGSVVYCEDFEDGEWNIPTDVQPIEQVYEYAIKVDSIFDHFETKEVGGSAVLIEQTPEFGATDVNTYIDGDSFENDGFRVNQGSFIMNFDLAVLPINDSADGSCFEMWTNRDKNGTNLARWKVGVMPTSDGLVGFAGMESGSTKDFVQFDWGDATIKNFHNVTYYIDFEHNVGQIYVDKTLVYEGKAGAKAWDNMIFMPHNASTVLDNIQLMDLDYNLNTNTTFKSSVARNIDLDAENLCEANGHINGKLARTAEPKCYELGQDTIYCAVCGEVNKTVAVPMTAHKWAAYDINRTTEDGLVKTHCTNGGCVQERYTTLPEDGTYTGTLYEYYDMSDDMVLVIDNSWNGGTWAAQDGFLKFGKGTDEKPHENNYNIFYPTKNVRAENWSWNLDLVYNGTFDTVGGSVDYEDGKPGYGHVLYFWFGGATTVAAQLGYNADKDKLFLVANNAGPNNVNPFPDGAFPATTVDYKLVEGEEYNFQISMQTIRTDDHELFDLTLYVNGEAMINADYEYIWNEETEEETITGSQDYLDNIAYPADQGELNYVVLRNFGISIDVDDMAFGTADFAYTNRNYKGDLSGDYTLTAEDTLLMRKYLARVLSAEDILTSRADVNGDGAINAKDQLVMRKALMA